MRIASKYRLIFFITAICAYTAGFVFLPEPITGRSDQLLTAMFGGLYGLYLPFLYWSWIIKKGQQKPWKLILILSLSGVMARYSFPDEIADVLFFIDWLRYPIIGILLAIEVYLMVVVIRGLWKARSATGDPRVTVIVSAEQDSGSQIDEKKLTLGVIMASEAASWYYAMPSLSRKHSEALGHLKLASASRAHWLMWLCAILLMCFVGYVMLIDISQTAAILVPVLIGYCVIMLTANHRICRHFSIYKSERHLVINNGMWGIMCIPLSQIVSVETGSWYKNQLPQALMIGKGEAANIKITLAKPIRYFSGLGQLIEEFDSVYLVTTDSKATLGNITERAPVTGTL